MAQFLYQKPYPVTDDPTPYRLLTKDYVSVEEAGGRRIVRIAPEGLELLAARAFSDVSFYLRPGHLAKLVSILNDPEASENDRFVAHTMLLNQVISAEGLLPTCQDTGTAIVIGKKGENVYTGVDDAEYLSKGIYRTFQERNLRYSMVVPLTMTDEKNTWNNLPAQVDLYATPGDEYEFLFITKGGGSANKTFLYQQSKSLLNEESLTRFITEKIKDLGTAACPPYHLALVIGGTSILRSPSHIRKRRWTCLPRYRMGETGGENLHGLWSRRAVWREIFRARCTGDTFTPSCSFMSCRNWRQLQCRPEHPGQDYGRGHIP
jgi:fumarate hydratase class I